MVQARGGGAPHTHFGTDPNGRTLDHPGRLSVSSVLFVSGAVVCGGDTCKNEHPCRRPPSLLPC
jgi:hypothetical protein